MPELPEVETVRLKISPYLIGKTIKSVDIFYSKYQLLEKIKDEKIIDIKRKGKFLIFVLSNYFMISHLRMEGKYRVEKNPVKLKHDLVIFNLDEYSLVYNDTRKFGIFVLYNRDEDIYNLEPLKNVGKEPFDISEDELFDSLSSRTIPIKTALLDQSVMSGLGNIYVDEVLFKSKVNPFRLANTATRLEVKDIIKNSIETLNNSIKAGGTTIRSFESFNGESGHFQGSLLIHSKEGERCINCSNYIIKGRCGGRGTYYCPVCQRLYNFNLYAITGTFASGKSTVLDIIDSLGYKTYSLDKIYNDLFLSDKKMQREILKNLGTIDKDKLREIVYSDKSKNELLKNITHKYIFKELFLDIEKNNFENIFVEVPLLFEDSYEKMFDKTIDVYESDEVKDIILKKRGINNYSKVSTNQLDREEKKERCDYIIYNFSDLNSLKENTINIIKEIIK